MQTLYQYSVYLVLIVAPIVFITLLFVSAPYGKHSRSGWGIMMNNRLAWIIMESPAVFVFLIVFLFYNTHPNNYLFLFLWELHYSYRTFYFPSKIKSTKKSFPVSIMSSAIFFNIINGFINAYAVTHLALIDDFTKIDVLQFAIAIVIFFIGFFIHVLSDKTILDLRSDGSTGYKIPYGGLFRYISNPNYFGELIQWIGWALLCGTLAGWAFAIFTFANLFPRAVSNHRWYKKEFDNYPNERKIFIPLVY
jgi:protein-S-isoprenylcysteine O-methyltransferase Ste14